MRPVHLLPVLLIAAAFAGCAGQESSGPSPPFGELRDGAVFHYRAQGIDGFDEPFDTQVAYTITALSPALRADGRIVDAYGWHTNATFLAPGDKTQRPSGLHRFAAAWAEPLSFFPDGPRLASLEPLVFPVRHDWLADLPAPWPVVDAPLMAFEPLLHGHAPGSTVVLGALELAFGGSAQQPTLCYREAGETVLCVEAEADGAPLPRRVVARDPRLGGDTWTLERADWTQGDGAPIVLAAGRVPKHSLPTSRAPMEERAVGPVVAVVPPLSQIPGLNFTPALEEAVRSRLAFGGPAPPRVYPAEWEFDLGYRLIGPDFRAYDATGTVVGSWRFQIRDDPDSGLVFRRTVYEHALGGVPVMEPATPDTWWSTPGIMAPGYDGPAGLEVVPLFRAAVHYAHVLDGPLDVAGWNDNAPWAEGAPPWWVLASHCHGDGPPTRLVLDARTGALRLAFHGVDWNDPLASPCTAGEQSIR